MMGCDIHAYMEYRKRDTRDARWNSFGKRINPGRNYRIFGALTNGEVRYDAPEGLALPPRGAPENMGYAAREDYWLWVTDGDERPWDNAVTRSDADRWIAEYGMPVQLGAGGKVQWVRNPDLHTPSWVTPEEWAKAIAHPEDANEVEYFAMLAALLDMERRGYEGRVVFWFDN